MYFKTAHKLIPSSAQVLQFQWQNTVARNVARAGPLSMLHNAEEYVVFVANRGGMGDLHSLTSLQGEKTGDSLWIWQTHGQNEYCTKNSALRTITCRFPQKRAPSRCIINLESTWYPAWRMCKSSDDNEANVMLRHPCSTNLPQSTW